MIETELVLRALERLDFLEERVAQLEDDLSVVVRKATEGFEMSAKALEVLQRRLNRMEQANGS